MNEAIGYMPYQSEFVDTESDHDGLKDLLSPLRRGRQWAINGAHLIDNLVSIRVLSTRSDQHFRELLEALQLCICQRRQASGIFSIQMNAGLD